MGTAARAVRQAGRDFGLRHFMDWGCCKCRPYSIRMRFSRRSPLARLTIWMVNSPGGALAGMEIRRCSSPSLTTPAPDWSSRAPPGSVISRLTGMMTPRSGENYLAYASTSMRRGWVLGGQGGRRRRRRVTGRGAKHASVRGAAASRTVATVCQVPFSKTWTS